MANGTRTAAIALVASMALTGAVGSAAAAQDDAAEEVSAGIAGIVRVRSPDRRISELITDAAEASPTFRDLLTAIAASDGIVYVDALRMPWRRRSRVPPAPRHGGGTESSPQDSGGSPAVRPRHDGIDRPRAPVCHRGAQRPERDEREEHDGVLSTPRNSTQRIDRNARRDRGGDDGPQ